MQDQWLDSMEKRFGAEFIFWFDDFSKTKLFCQIWDKVRLDDIPRTALLMSVGIAYTQGRALGSYSTRAFEPERIDERP